MNRRRFVQTAVAAAGLGLLPAGAFALQYTPRPSPEKWAILYGSRYGAARDAAVWIAEGMGGIAHVFDAKEKPDATRFDHWVIGGGIYYGSFDQALTEWVVANRDALTTRTRAVFVVAGSAGTPGAASYVASLAEACGGSPRWKTDFPGRVTRRLLSPDDDKALDGFYRNLQQPYEDYDRLTRKMAFDFGDLIHRESTTAVAAPPSTAAQP
jgi:menaquinone-dependent protoporphyrinogen oxidase